MSFDPPRRVLHLREEEGMKKREKMVYKKRAEKRVSGYRPSRVCLIVPTSKLRL